MRKSIFMKYVWASWGSKLIGQLPGGENINENKTRHIKGYGCAVSFSSTRVAWSSAHATYSLESKHFELSISRA
ncbi:MAG: hypothetical protein WD824_02145 [Cyclobacteriaceae bacterium]